MAKPHPVGYKEMVMRFGETKLAGAFEIQSELRTDERGYFARIFCEEEFQKQGINFHIRQVNRSFNTVKGTLRGFHFQKPPKWEAKCMTALLGAFFVAIVDLRPNSPTFKQWISVELSAEKKNMLLVPVGCANAFQTLEDNSEMLYFMSELYSPEHQSGINYKDPDIGVMWPLEPTVVSPKDVALPMLRELL